MPSVAEVWLASDLAELPDDPRQGFQADLYRCLRETGWLQQPFSATPSEGLLRTLTLQAPYGGQAVEMRVHQLVPVLGFVDADVLSESLDEWASAWVGWGFPYINPAPLVAWWQAAGWLVPDAGWLNGIFASAELSALDPAEARELKRHHALSRGDAIFFEW